MTKPQSWDSFREAGLFVFVNSFLHIFGWAIVLDIHDDKVVNVYPAKVDFKGFPEDKMTEAYERITKYLNINEEQN